MPRQRAKTPSDIRFRIREIYEGECANSDDPRFEHRGHGKVHHEIPRSEGGLDEKGNLILLCNDCEAFTHELYDRHGRER